MGELNIIIGGFEGQFGDQNMLTPLEVSMKTAYKPRCDLTEIIPLTILFNLEDIPVKGAALDVGPPKTPMVVWFERQASNN